MTSHVERVQRFSTGTVDIHPQHAYRGRSPMYWWMLASRKWLAARPINVYVIEHTDGLVVFDTGQDRASVTDPDYFPGGLSGVIYSRLATFHIDEDETVTAGLERLGYRSSEVTTAVISHFHQDHIGGVAEIPQANMLVSADEWRSLHRPLPEPRVASRPHRAPRTDLDTRRLPTARRPGLGAVHHGHDLFGDGSLVILPTPGHTPGSMSMLLRRSNEAPLLLVGDLTYDVHAFDRGVQSGVGSRRQLRRTRDRVLALRSINPGMQILAAHDPAPAGLLDAATAAHAQTAPSADG